MATFERCFLSEKELQKEEKGAYYTLREEESVCDMLLDEFGVTGEHRHIVNGHVPVRSIKGENPIKANGKLLVIDGGFSKAYHSETGIAGYTLVYHSRGFQLVQHEPFQSTTKAIEEGLDIRSTTIVVELSAHRQMVKDTDKGAELKQQIHDLENLLYAYRNGLLQERERELRYYYVLGYEESYCLITIIVGLSGFAVWLEPGLWSRLYSFTGSYRYFMRQGLFFASMGTYCMAGQVTSGGDSSFCRSLLGRKWIAVTDVV